MSAYTDANDRPQEANEAGREAEEDRLAARISDARLAEIVRYWDAGSHVSSAEMLTLFKELQRLRSAPGASDELAAELLADDALLQKAIALYATENRDGGPWIEQGRRTRIAYLRRARASSPEPRAALDELHQMDQDMLGKRSPEPSETHQQALDRACYIIMELMQAYERRLRSDCITQAQIDNKPWECAEYIKGERFLKAIWKDGRAQPFAALDEFLGYLRGSPEPRCGQWRISHTNPAPDALVLVCYEDGTREITRGHYVSSNPSMYPYWMPLPAPYSPTKVDKP